MRLAAVWVSFRSLMAQREQWDTYWEPKKLIFLIRDIDGPTRAAAPVKICQFVVLGFLGSRFWVGKIHVQSPTPYARALPPVHTYKQGPLRSIALDRDLPKISIQSSLESTKRCRMRRRRLSDTRPIPEGVREPICIRKK